MNKKSISVSVFFSAIIVGGFSGITRSETDFFEQQKLTSHLIINLFLLNVDQGKLEIFDQTIKRSQLKSHQVAYIHNLKDDSLTVSIYMNLKEPVLIPHFEDLYINLISVDIDKDGNIQQVKSHVTPWQ